MNNIYKDEIRRFLYTIYHDKYCIITFSNDENPDNEQFKEIKISDESTLKNLTAFVEASIREEKGFEKYRILEGTEILVRWIIPEQLVTLQNLINFNPDFIPNSIEVGYPYREI